MSYYLPEEADPDMEFMEEDEFPDCDFGPEFCDHPDLKSMNLCTTECPTYFELVRLQEEETKASEAVR